MILIALMWARILPDPDTFKRVIKYHTFKTYCDFESVANIVFSFETNFGSRSIQSIQSILMAVAIINDI